MIALRIEHKDGYGPYNCRYHEPRYESEGWNGFDMRDGKRPSPILDGIHPGETDVFAFASYQQLLKWCDGEPPQPIECYRVVVYFCPDCFVQVGGSQIAFKREHAQRLSELPFSQVWEGARRNAAS